MEERGLELVVARKSVESWILAGLRHGEAENIDDPKGELEKAIRGRTAKTREHYRRLAEKIKVETALSNSKSFRKFIERLKDC